MDEERERLEQERYEQVMQWQREGKVNVIQLQDMPEEPSLFDMRKMQQSLDQCGKDREKRRAEDELVANYIKERARNPKYKQSHDSKPQVSFVVRWSGDFGDQLFTIDITAGDNIR